MDKSQADVHYDDEARYLLRRQLDKVIHSHRTYSRYALLVSVFIKFIVVVLLWQFFVLPKLGQRGPVVFLVVVALVGNLLFFEATLLFKRWR